MTTNEFVTRVLREYGKANEKYPKFQSNHEGFAVLLEEIEETEDEIVKIRKISGNLWEKVKREKSLYPTEEMIEEVVQIAAMCLKFCVR